MSAKFYTYGFFVLVALILVAVYVNYKQSRPGTLVGAWPKPAGFLGLGFPGSNPII